MKVISWSFYVDLGNMVRLPEYLVGLKCNQRAARLWFPGWNLRLYLDPKTKEIPAIWKWIREVCEYGEPKIEIVECREGKHPKIERYRPIFDPTVSVFIARDIDSILSKIDADMVNVWLEEEQYDVLQYLEHKMDETWIMGGGLGFKRNPNTPCDDTNYITSNYLGDERMLSKIVKTLVPISRWKKHITRMSKKGNYYIKCFHEGLTVESEPIKSQILWTVPFYDVKKGYAFNYPNTNWLKEELEKGKNYDKIIQWVKTFRIRCEHTGSHWHNEEISTKEKWIR
jgi:hypothetical protein